MTKNHYLPIHLVLVALAASYAFGYTPLLLSVAFALFSLLAYAAYAKDKSAARKGNWRVSEKTLHLLSLLCGWPGAILAQQRLRHKTQKRRFRAVFWLTLLLNLSGLAWLHTVDGSKGLGHALYQVESLAVKSFGVNSATNTLLTLTKLRR